MGTDKDATSTNTKKDQDHKKISVEEAKSKVSIETKYAERDLKIIECDEKLGKIDNDLISAKLDVMQRISHDLQAACVDDEKTLVGGEIMWQNVFNADEEKKLKEKYFLILDSIDFSNNKTQD